MDSYATTLVHAAAAASRTRAERKGKSAAKEARKARARRSKKLTAAAGETTAETGAESPQLEVDEPDELPEAEPTLSARDMELQKETKMRFGWKTRAEPEPEPKPEPEPEPEMPELVPDEPDERDTPEPEQEPEQEQEPEV